MANDILDSEHKETFETGAVRDPKKGKGRCDLMPLDVIGELLEDPFISCIGIYIKTLDPTALYACVEQFCIGEYGDVPTGLLDVSVHYENGAEIYGERNWEKGLPVHGYINSAIRHRLKMIRGDDDENHKRAFLWNILCALWTIKNKDELIDIYSPDFNNI